MLALAAAAGVAIENARLYDEARRQQRWLGASGEVTRTLLSGADASDALVLITALRVFLASGGSANLGIASTGGLVDLLVSACMCWVLVKIPGWVSRPARSGTGQTPARGHHAPPAAS